MEGICIRYLYWVISWSIVQSSVSYAAPSLQITSNRLSEGDIANITCLKKNSRKNITMLIDGNMVDGLELRHQLDGVTLVYNSWVTLSTSRRDWNKKNVTCCEYDKEFTNDDYSMCSSPEPVDFVLPLPTLTLSPLETIDHCVDCIVGEDTVRVTVSCKINGGTEPYSVTLRIGDTRLVFNTSETGEYKATFQLNSTLDHMANLTCSVEYHAATVSVSVTANVYVTVVPYAAPSLHITSHRLIEGDPGHITCLKENIRPAATNITMLIDGNMVDGLELRHDLDDVTLLYNSWVTLTKFQRDWNKKNVTCCEYNEEYFTDDYWMCSSPKSVDFVSVKLTDDSRNSSVYVLPDAKSWLEGFNACKREKNASDEDYVYKLPENKTYIAELVNIHGPLWTYGLEVIFHQNGKTKIFQINRRNPSLPSVGVCSWEDRDPAMSIVPNQSYTEALTACHKANTSIPIVTPTNITIYGNDLFVRSSFWVAYINEELFLNDAGIDVRCLLYDSNGDIKTDDCNSKHKTLCVTENALPVVKYVNNVTLPRLQTESPKGTSPSITNTHGSKKTNDKKLSSSPSSTPSSSSRTKSGILMDPQIQYTVIGVGSAIVIAIVIAICVCCCKRKQQNTPTERQSTQLADTYSETMDSMQMKEQSIYETPNNSEYATPDDAIRKARQRQSIGENEYDVINADPKKKKPSGVAANAYNHVTLVSSKDKQNTSDMDENQYDVTNYGRQALVLISPKDNVGNEYGHVEIKVER